MNASLRFQCMVITVLATSTSAAQADTRPATSPQQAARGSLKGLTLLKTFSRADIDAANPYRALSGRALCDVKVLELVYASIGVRGEPADLSAAVYLPSGCAGPMPLLAEGHGTEPARHYSAVNVGAGNSRIGFFASHGYAVVTSDYLGLGKSSYPFHPYLHADSEASAIIDAIRAARHALQRLNAQLSGKVMLFGYSQGGHATMAAQREIERHHSAEIKLVASAPMAGPYALTQTFLGAWFGRTNGQTNPLVSELLGFTLVSYQNIYKNIYRVPTDVVRAPYAERIEKLFPGAMDLFQIRQAGLLPAGEQVNELRQPLFTADFLTNADNPLRQGLARNELLDWTPRTPTVLCSSSGDSIVDFKNTLAAQAVFQARGAHVPVIDVASDVPAGASGTQHHAIHGAPLCFAKVRQALFDAAR